MEIIRIPEGVRAGQLFQADVGGQRVSVTVPDQIPPNRCIRVRVATPQGQQLFRVAVPPGVHPGMSFQADMGGQHFQVTVPQDHGPGSMLTVSAPAASASPMAQGATQKLTAMQELAASAARRDAAAAKREAVSVQRECDAENREAARRGGAEGRTQALAEEVSRRRAPLPRAPTASAIPPRFARSAVGTANAPPRNARQQLQLQEVSALWWLNMGL